MAAELLVLVISCGAVAAGWNYARTARRTRSFATTPGRVIGREIAAAPGPAGREGRWGSGGGWQPKVTYTYVVDGVNHTSDRWSHATAGLKRSVAAQRLAGVADDVVVHYDPRSPADAYLQLHRPGLGYALIAAGAIGVVAASAALLG